MTLYRRRDLLALAPLLLAGCAMPMIRSALAAGTPVRIVALGDSLTAGYLLPQDAAFPTVLERALRARGHAVEIANAGVSGDTTAAGLQRLDWSVPDGTHGVILELGANDALRGSSPKAAEENLDAIIMRLKARGIAVLIAGMLAPRNNGPDYVAAFDPIFRRLAERHGLMLYPFFMDGVLGEPGMLLADGIHPTRAGVERIVAGILPTAEKFVETIGRK